MFAVLNFLPYPADLSIGHLRCVLQAAQTNDFNVKPAVGWLASAHRDALLGLDDADARKRALVAMTVVDMGPPLADGQYARDRRDALAAAMVRRPEAV